jgi:nitroimidazol reductase NimA-like FMN-containing flavoprotein (pyridoxamine 5'-phosphate oxidase superfamily)
MRRTEKMIRDPARVEQLLATAAVCRIAFNASPYPYVVPVNFACEGRTLYVHSPLAGEKLDRLRADPHVCVEVDEQLSIRPGDAACSWGTRYRSVVGRGIASLVEEPARKSAALELLLRKYSGREGWSVPAGALDGVAVVAVALHELAGKESI